MKKQTLTAELTAKIEELATTAFNRAIAEKRSLCIAQDKASFDFFFTSDFATSPSRQYAMRVWNDFYMKAQRANANKELEAIGFWDKVNADHKAKFGE